MTTLVVQIILHPFEIPHLNLAWYWIDHLFLQHWTIPPWNLYNAWGHGKFLYSFFFNQIIWLEAISYNPNSVSLKLLSKFCFIKVTRDQSMFIIPSFILSLMSPYSCVCEQVPCNFISWELRCDMCSKAHPKHSQFASAIIKRLVVVINIIQCECIMWHS